MRKFLMITAAALILTACSNAAADKTKTETSKAPEAANKIEASSTKTHKKAKKFDAAKLDTVLAAQSDKAQARYGATKILVPYLGEEGELMGIDYSIDLWPEFSFANEEFIEKKKNWPTEFVTKTAEWAPADGAAISATTFGGTAGDKAGSLDAVLFFRALHNLSRYESEGQYLTQALSKTHELLKPGGIVGVVQHRAPESAEDSWAVGSAGYLKQSNVIAAFDAAGFELVKKSNINANPKDKPVGDDVVWRLPPSLRGSDETKAEREAIGESNRMTLLFKKR